MRRLALLLLWIVGIFELSLVGDPAWTQPQVPLIPRVPVSTPLVLAGGTVVDVTDWGRSARDQQDAIVIVRDGRITDVGPRGAEASSMALPA
jgi:hypothetical protein